MIQKGCYEIIQILNISSSLNSQLECQQKSNETLKKCLLNGNIVIYMIDPVDLGNKSRIEILKNLSNALVSKDDFRIIKREEYKHDIKFIEKLRKK